MSEIGLVAGMGGILSLCMGFSLVTLAETGYHAMLGILSFIKEYRKQKTNKTGKYIPLTELKPYSHVIFYFMPGESQISISFLLSCKMLLFYYCVDNS